MVDQSAVSPGYVSPGDSVEMNDAGADASASPGAGASNPNEKQKETDYSNMMSTEERATGSAFSKFALTSYLK